MKTNKAEHPSDTFLHTLDECLNDMLKRLTPWLGSAGSTNTGGQIEGYVTPEKIVARLQQHITTNLEVELREVITGRGDAGVDLVEAAATYPSDKTAQLKAQLHDDYKGRRAKRQEMGKR